MEAVTLTNISKRYGSVEALRGVSLSVAPGELFGIIGPDGAGKTSLFRILTTLLLADGGSASVCGLDVVKDYKAIRRRVGYMPGRFSLYPDLTVEENLNFFATVFHTTIEENYDLVRDIYRQIEPFRKRRAGALSGGMKQKLALSCALIHKPDVLFLDEPTTGVDPVSRKEFWGMLRRLKERGITIIASTPIIDEARQCDRIAFINEGEIKGIDTPDRILTRFAGILCPPGLQHERVENHENKVIEVEGLTKRFGNFTAVDHISFQVHRGEIFGFLGANGAGKTTAMRMLTVYVLNVPVAGSLFWLVVVSLLFIFVSLALGLLISTVTRTQVAAMLVSGLMLMMPTMLLSGMIFPIESMPVILQAISAVLPARWYIQAVRKLMIEGVDVSLVLMEVGILATMAVLLITVSFKKFKHRLE